MKRYKYALVLSGGGFNGAFQLGALNYLERNWKQITGLSTPMYFDIIAGVSAGALNGAMIAMNKITLLNDLWVNQIGKNGVSEIYTSDVIDTSSNADKLKMKLDLKHLSKRLIPKVDLELKFMEKLGIVLSKGKRKEIINRLIESIEESIKLNFSKFRSIADNTPLRDKLDKYLNRGKIKTNYYCGFVSLDSGAYHSVHYSDFLTKRDFVNGVLASTSIPIVWNPVPSILFRSENKVINSLNNIDGGIRNVSPLGDVIKQIRKEKEEYKIIIINTNSGTIKQEDFSQKSIGSIAARSVYDIAITEIFNNDVDHFLKINDILSQVKQCADNISIKNKFEEELKTFDALVINPDKDVDMGSSLVANQSLIELRMAHGHEMAEKAVNEKDVNNE